MRAWLLLLCTAFLVMGESRVVRVLKKLPADEIYPYPAAWDPMRIQPKPIRGHQSALLAQNEEELEKDIVSNSQLLVKYRHRGKPVNLDFQPPQNFHGELMTQLLHKNEITQSKSFKSEPYPPALPVNEEGNVYSLPTIDEQSVFEKVELAAMHGNSRGENSAPYPPEVPLSVSQDVGLKPQVPESNKLFLSASTYAQSKKKEDITFSGPYQPPPPSHEEESRPLHPALHRINYTTLTDLPASLTTVEIIAPYPPAAPTLSPEEESKPLSPAPPKFIPNLVESSSELILPVEYGPPHVPSTEAPLPPNPPTLSPEEESKPLPPAPPKFIPYLSKSSSESNLLAEYGPPHVPSTEAPLPPNPPTLSPEEESKPLPPAPPKLIPFVSKSSSDSKLSIQYGLPHIHSTEAKYPQPPPTLLPEEEFNPLPPAPPKFIPILFESSSELNLPIEYGPPHVPSTEEPYPPLPPTLSPEEESKPLPPAPPKSIPYLSKSSSETNLPAEYGPPHVFSTEAPHPPHPPTLSPEEESKPLPPAPPKSIPYLSKSSSETNLPAEYGPPHVFFTEAPHPPHPPTLSPEEESKPLPPAPPKSIPYLSTSSSESNLPAEYGPPHVPSTGAPHPPNPPTLSPEEESKPLPPVPPKSIPYLSKSSSESKLPIQYGPPHVHSTEGPYPPPPPTLLPEVEFNPLPPAPPKFIPILFESSSELNLPVEYGPPHVPSTEAPHPPQPPTLSPEEESKPLPPAPPKSIPYLSTSSSESNLPAEYGPPHVLSTEAPNPPRPPTLLPEEESNPLPPAPPKSVPFLFESSSESNLPAEYGLPYVPFKKASYQPSSGLKLNSDSNKSKNSTEQNQHNFSYHIHPHSSIIQFFPQPIFIQGLPWTAPVQRNVLHSHPEAHAKSHSFYYSPPGRFYHPAKPCLTKSHVHPPLAKLAPLIARPLKPGYYPLAFQKSHNPKNYRGPFFGHSRW